MVEDRIYDEDRLMCFYNRENKKNAIGFDKS